ncbi:hypothetical protein FRC12_015622 [Ceratobasidium sp. 428]|nr:hypothetical protein FRC12_015622 [Ceratobasidium sp. 428]
MSGQVVKDSAHYPSDDFYLYCSVCCDLLGNPKKVDMRGARRHLRSSGHRERLAKLRIEEKKRKTSSKEVDNVEPGLVSYEESYPLSAPIAAQYAPDNFEGKQSANVKQRTPVGDLFATSQDQEYADSASESESVSEISDSDSTSDSDTDCESVYTYNFGSYSTSSDSCDWRPWPSKSVFLADLITNSKRLKFTRRQTRAMLSYARETGGRDIPSYKTLRKLQKKMKSHLGDPTVRKVSCTGNVFYMNRVTNSLVQDMSNPYLRKHMTFYPHFDDKRISQIWNGDKLLWSVPDHVLTPTIRHCGQIYYVGELVQRKQGWFLPLRWILKGEGRELYGVGHTVEETQYGLHVLRNRRIAVPVTTFCRSFPELLQSNAIPVFDDESQSFRVNMPHRLREQAGLRPVYSIPIILFMDDVSGGISKHWNKHISSYFSNGALTREVLNSEYSVQFIVTSKHASPSELMQGIREDLEESFQNPVAACDCEAHEEVLIQGYPVFSAADNPMQAEQCSCQLQNANFSCRTCGAGGTTEFKQSEGGYPTLFRAGEKRNPLQTRGRVNALVEMSIQPGRKTHIKEQARDWGIKDTLGQLAIDRMIEMRETQSSRHAASEITSSLQLELGRVRRQGCFNTFLDMDLFGFDAHQDTPTEILHTVLLGVVKYFWGQTVFLLSKSHQMHKLQARLSGLSTSGLNIDSISEKYMCHYTGSLVGKHFKILAQLMPFACYDLVETDLMEAWLLLGRLTVLLWFTEIENIDTYLVELQLIIDDFLLAAARCSPSIIVLKPKFHFLVHLPTYIRRLGPAIMFSTERFESFHGVFRAGSVFSNHQAPSRDIAEYFIILTCLAGGYWKAGVSWVRASTFVCEFILGHPEFSNLLGIPSGNHKDVGHVVFLPRQHAQSCVPAPWHEFGRDRSLLPSVGPGPPKSTYFHILSTYSQSSDPVKVGSNVLLQSQTFAQIKALFGCVEPNGTIVYYASASGYQVSARKHDLFDMPVLEPYGDLFCVSICSLVCLVNLQHDCVAAGDCALRPVAERQEREDISQTCDTVQHSNNQRYILNTHGLHCIQRIRLALPEPLLAWRGLGVNQSEIHNEAVKKLALATNNKSLQAEARRAAKEAFKSVVEGMDGNQHTESEAEPRPPKRQRKPRLKTSGTKISSQPDDHPRSSASTNPPGLSTDVTETAANLAAPSLPIPSSQTTPTHVSYSDFWANFRR